MIWPFILLFCCTYFRERQQEPKFASPGSFEYSFGQKWKELYMVEEQQKEELKKQMDDAVHKLEMDMESALQEHTLMSHRQGKITVQIFDCCCRFPTIDIGSKFEINQHYIQTCQTSANWRISDFFVWFWVILVNRPDPV